MNKIIDNTEGGFLAKEAALLPIRLFPSAAYYALMAHYPIAYFDKEARYNKAEKGTHRFTIADTRGELRLTIPVSRPSGCKQWKEVLVSDHGRWWETMPIALESAYGRTPFFEFYIDRFKPLFSSEPRSIYSLCLDADAIVRDILKIPTAIKELDENDKLVDYTKFDFDKAALNMPRYWQVRGESLGFIPGMSILDLIFNMGPEATLYIDSTFSTLGVENSKKDF